MAKIKEFKDGTFLEYSGGRFDNWCVYYTDTEGKRNAPKDSDYFGDLYNFSKKYGKEKVYADYIKVYDKTNKIIEDKVLKFIEQVAKSYDEQDMLEVEKMFTILYMGMIAEERRKNTKLGKRIKRLGVHELLVGNKPIQEAATFMTGMNWREIDKLCTERGF